MTVQELKTLLESYNDDAEIVIVYPDDDMGFSVKSCLITKDNIEQDYDIIRITIN